jgi:hypothetical protein
MSANRRDRVGGFALIESIAVLLLSALVLLTLLIGADILTRSSAVAARRANELETLATGFAALRRDIETTRLVEVGEEGEKRVLFSGEPRELFLVAGEDPYDPGDRDSFVRIRAQYDDNRGVLSRSSADYQPGATDFSGVGFSELALVLSGPWQYKFSYGDVGPTGLRWGNQWSEPSRMPAAIRVEVLNAAGNAPVAPPLVVRLRIDSTGACDPEIDPECQNENENPPEQEPTDETNGQNDQQ